MINKNASIEKIDRIYSHPNADMLEIAEILGFKVCIKKGEFQENEKCIYIRTDTIVEDLPQYEFLRNKNFRIKTIKLRGEVSQGLCLPLRSFNILDKTEIGKDVSIDVGASHYEKPIPISLTGLVKGSFPSFLIRTDEPQVKNFPNIIEEFKDKLIYITLKADGTSGTCYLKDENFGVCSRNLELKEEESSVYWKMARKFKVEEALKAFRSIYPGDYACQFEIVGPGVQKNPLKLTENSIRVFNLFSITRQCYSHYETLVEFCIDNNLPLADVIYAGKFDFTLERLQEIANKIEYIPGVEGEGIVIRPIQEEYSNILKGRLSIKVLNENYSIRHAE